ncbi:MAG TPA: hypothetical protein VH350_14930 [Candidatus Sulfotelmatobacter sp.]|jgi:hypothetical protein|nr:hypothetical protein [Candidatus Sulfotelmatobacter sp.]
MTKKLIGALLLALLALGNTPLALATPLLQSGLGTRTGQQASSNPHNHSCCPDAPARFALLIVTPVSTMPCGEQHPCCAKQVPENPPALPIATSTQKPNPSGVPMAMADQTQGSRAPISAESAGSNPFHAYSGRNTVLRI